MVRIENGMYLGNVVRVSEWRRGDEVLYAVQADGYIELETRSLEMANGIAAALEATVRDGHRYSRADALWMLSRLVEGRRLLAGIVESNAAVLGNLKDATVDAAHRLYGKQSE